MKMSKSIRSVSIIVSYLMFGIYGYGYGIPEHPFSMDRLYPENWYTKAHEHCLMVWGTLEDILQRSNHGLPAYLVDTSIGQLVFAKNCVHNLIKNNFGLMPDDIVYLSRLVATIEERCARLPQTVHTDKIHLLQYVIEKIKKKIDLLLRSARPVE